MTYSETWHEECTHDVETKADAYNILQDPRIAETVYFACEMMVNGTGECYKETKT